MTEVIRCRCSHELDDHYRTWGPGGLLDHCLRGCGCSLFRWSSAWPTLAGVRVPDDWEVKP